MPAAPAVSAGQSPDGREGQSKKEARKGATGRPVASPETTPGPDGLDATAFRTAVRNAVGQERWVARFARLRVVNGWLVCLSWGDAACLWRDFGPVLQAAGVSVIWAEHEQREVKT